MLLIQIGVCLIILGLAIPSIVLWIECLAALSPGQPNQQNSSSRPTIAVLIPAHNEAVGIAATLKTVIPQLTPSDRLLVVADNCSDETAAISRQLGAIVIERQNLIQKGKGYAIDYGLKFLQTNSPDIVVLIDADCHVEPGMIEQSACLAKTSGRPVQSVNLLAPPAQPNLKARISSFAFTVKNLVRPQGLSRLGLPCLLSTGVAFPWAVIQSAPLAHGNIVEDMQLAIDLALAGHPALFCSTAKITGRLPQQGQAATSQRTRWEHGHLKTLVTQVPRLLAASIQQKRFDLFAIALDLCIPPLSLLVMLWIAAFILVIGLGMGTEIWLPAQVTGIIGGFLVLVLLGVWAKFGRSILSFSTLIAIPFYIFWKLPIYFKFLTKPQKNWVRTERDIA